VSRPQVIDDEEHEQVHDRVAAFLDAHPGLPVPRFSMCAGLTVYPGGSFADKRAEVDRIADVLQAVTDDFGVYQAERRFGGSVAYRVVAVPESDNPTTDGPGAA